MSSLPAQPPRFFWQGHRTPLAFKALNFPGLPQSVWTAEDAQLELEVIEELQREQLEELTQGGRMSPDLAELPIPNLDGAALGSVLGFSTVADFDGDGARESLARVQTSRPKNLSLPMMADHHSRAVSGRIVRVP